LVITLPTHAKPQEAEAFLLKHRQWAIRHLDGLAARWAQIPRAWPYGTSLLVRGEEHEVEVSKARPGHSNHWNHAEARRRKTPGAGTCAGFAGASRDWK
jgi:hypothetical protein